MSTEYQDWCPISSRANLSLAILNLTGDEQLWSALIAQAYIDILPHEVLLFWDLVTRIVDNNMKLAGILKFLRKKCRRTNI